MSKIYTEYFQKRCKAGRENLPCQLFCKNLSQKYFAEIVKNPYFYLGFLTIGFLYWNKLNEDHAERRDPSAKTTSG